MVAFQARTQIKLDCVAPGTPGAMARYHALQDNDLEANITRHRIIRVAPPVLPGILTAELFVVFLTNEKVKS